MLPSSQDVDDKLEPAAERPPADLRTNSLTSVPPALQYVSTCRVYVLSHHPFPYIFDYSTKAVPQRWDTLFLNPHRQYSQAFWKWVPLADLNLTHCNVI
ncbi:hypothetical protein PoB_007358200 [Plakobranchus ocellatus]|uniref:Uncharacterized protein n=1 Tax=Plakobranchus ocellatus TaxID=259542 RepID=A0AAV4DSR4_9GAST|nr:hypothetical protein PoB_007358200 [Plakobranchus ocellatus]